MAVNVGTITLSNSLKLPLLGYGTWLATDEEQLKTALRTALDVGYRYIDTAAIYGNEKVIGDVLQEYYDAGKLKREEIFLTTKLPFYAHQPAVAEKVLKKSLSQLRTSYIDLYLVHAPLPMKPTETHDGPAKDDNGKFIPIDVPLIDTWRFMEKHYKEGTLKSIGLSNFNEEQIQAICDQAGIKPHNLQVELHVLWPQNALVDFCKKHKISVTSYATIGSPGRGKAALAKYVEGDCMNHSVVQEVAKKYNKTPAQILLRHTLQRGISVIPKSTNSGRATENISIFDFEIKDEDVEKLDNVQPHKRLFLFDFAWHHPNHPFPDTKP